MMLRLGEKQINVTGFSRRRLMLVVVGMSTCQLAAGGQVGRRSVRGSVTDRAGIPLKGAVVRIKNTWSHRVRTCIVQADGVYRFLGLLPNVDYELKARFFGASSGTKKLDRFDPREERVIDIVIDLARGGSG